MKRLALYFISFMISSVYAGELSLYDCYEKALENHPLQQEIRNRQQIYDLNRKNLNANWLPLLNANANAVYMSDVVKFDQVLGNLPFPIPAGSFSTMPRDQYKITLELRQTIYDGGTVSAGKKVEQAALQTDLLTVESELYKVRDQINQLYFALLLLDKQSELTALFKNEILQRRDALQSAVKNGAVLPSNLDILEAELIKVEQKITELNIQHDKTRQGLFDVIGEEISDARFILPTAQLPERTRLQRPELRLFDHQKMTLEKQKKILQSQRLPKAAVFGTFGYGQPPGNNFFIDSFDTYYVVGATVNWNIFDWHSTRRSKHALQARQHIIDAKEENFKRQLHIATENSQAEIEKIESLLKSDEQLIALREKIKKAAASKLENGAISSTEFLTELNAEREARINFEMHKIQLVHAKINFLTITGQIYEN